MSETDTLIDRPAAEISISNYASGCVSSRCEEQCYSPGDGEDEYYEVGSRLHEDEFNGDAK
ncbi:hypothetical protein [Methanococcoides burtonii]|uniref:hypothetical protein n=1 Tax=Methanococcoides burtonii TaxID=29291 RepID=UPI00003996A9|nr:hypothetical protein [Methanococcoides burtonii]